MDFKTNNLELIETVMNLFKGRYDCYAQYGESWYPACKFHKVKSYCEKFKKANFKCKGCNYRSETIPFTRKIYRRHFVTGELEAGLYLLTKKYQVHVGAVDFDEPKKATEEQKIQVSKDAISYYQTCIKNDVPAYFEKSKSKGFHVWHFFDEALNAKIVIKFINLLFKLSEIKTKYEIFPKQAELSPGSKFGSLIRLPLHKKLCESGQCIFLDPVNNFKPFNNQLELLKSIEKITKKGLQSYIKQLSKKTDELNKESVIKTVKKKPNKKSNSIKIDKLNPVRSKKEDKIKEKESISNIRKKCECVKKCIEYQKSVGMDFDQWYGFCWIFIPLGGLGEEYAMQISSLHPNDYSDSEDKFELGIINKDGKRVEIVNIGSTTCKKLQDEKMGELKCTKNELKDCKLKKKDDHNVSPARFAYMKEYNKKN